SGDAERRQRDDLQPGPACPIPGRHLPVERGAEAAVRQPSGQGARDADETMGDQPPRPLAETAGGDTRVTAHVVVPRLVDGGNYRVAVSLPGGPIGIMEERALEVQAMKQFR